MAGLEQGALDYDFFSGLTSKDTKYHEREEAGRRLAGQAGAEFSNPFTSELARDSENTSLIRSADNPASLPATSQSLPVTAPEACVLNLDDLSEGEKQDALAACDLLCVPSEGESFGMVYFEAWAYKKPVVALDLPVLRESIGCVEGGVIAESEPKSIAEVLIKMLSGPELCREMGNRGYELALQHDWPRALESYSIAYQNLRS